jgi:hypothetical protein
MRKITFLRGLVKIERISVANNHIASRNNFLLRCFFKFFDCLYFEYQIGFPNPRPRLDDDLEHLVIL